MTSEVTEELCQAAEDLIQREIALPDVRSDVRGTGWSEDLWAATAAAGWSDVLLGEEHGGLGFGLDAATGLFSLIGRHLVPGPYLDLVVTVPLLYGYAPPAVRTRLDKARAGGEILILADPAANCRAPGTVELRGGSLNGTVDLLRHGAIADGFIVIARHPEAGPVLALVDVSDPAVVIRPRDWFDCASPVGDVSFGYAKIPHDHLIPMPGDCRDGAPMDRPRARLRLMIAAELSGLARHMLEASVSYAKVREQFAQPIGSFQAVQQILAEMAVQLLGAEAFTAECAAVEVALKGIASQVARHVGESALQVHGSIAFTEEFEDNRWYFRILTLKGLYGDQAASYRDTGRALLAQGSRNDER